MKHLIKPIKLASLLMAFILPSHAIAVGESKAGDYADDAACSEGLSSDGSTNSITLFAKLLAATNNATRLAQVLHDIATLASPRVLRAGTAMILEAHRANPKATPAAASRLLQIFQTIQETEDDELIRTLFLGVTQETPYAILSNFLAIGLQSLRSLVSHAPAFTQEMQFADMRRTNPNAPLCVLWGKILQASPDTLRNVIIPIIANECTATDIARLPITEGFIENLQIAQCMDDEVMHDVFNQTILNTPCTLLHRLRGTMLEISGQIDEASSGAQQLSSADPRYTEERRMLLGHHISAAEKLNLHRLDSPHAEADGEMIACAGAGAVPIDEDYYEVCLSPSDIQTPHAKAITAAKASISIGKEKDLDFSPINIIKEALKFMYAHSQYAIPVSSLNLESIINCENPQTVFLDFASINAHEFSSTLAEDIVNLVTEAHPDLKVLSLKNIPFNTILHISSGSLIRLILDNNPNPFSLPVLSAPKLTELSTDNTALEPADLENLETIVIANITATETMAEASCSASTEVKL